MQETTRVRISSFVWFIYLIFISSIWWTVCIAEWLSKRKSKFGHGYFRILRDAYAHILSEFKRVFIEIKTGRSLWK